MPDSSFPPVAPAADAAATVLQVVAALARETRAGGGDMPPPRLDTALERDLGFDSLERAELLLRLERAFHVRLPARTLVEAETPRDLVRAVLAGSAHAMPAAGAVAAPVAEPAAAIPEHAQTLVEVLEWHAHAHGERTQLTLLAETDAGPVERPLTYGELHRDALSVAAGLVRGGLEPGQAVAIMLPTSLDFFAAFFGVLFAGGVPVPIYPPASRSQLEEHFRRQSKIVANALATVLITIPEARGVARLLRAASPALRQIVSVPQLREAPLPPRSRPGPQDIAFLQYTSGSTGQPKGVTLTHANVLANMRAIGRALDLQPTDVFVSWLPLYHDMGLIGAWFGTLYFAVPLVVMPPTDFLARPESWLRAMHRHRGTLSAGPNFAYEMCATRIDAAALAGLDLSSWRVAFNGAEPVSPDTIARFNARFAVYGFDARAQFPVYGLAECAVGLAFPPVFRGALVDRVDRGLLAGTGIATPARADNADALRLVACGRPLPGHEIRIVDAGGHELPERHEGRIEFRGPSATSGYFRNPEATRALFDGDWLATGDLGYVAGGEIHLTGRAKDLIIRGGQHIHPQEAEAAIGGIRGVRKGCVTVFGVPDRAAGTEKVVVLAETRESDPGRREALRAAIAALGLALLGAPPDDIVLAPPHTVLKTSSGKIRRAACSDLYQRGALRPGSRRLWPQLARLSLIGLAASVRRWFRRAGEFLFGIYAWALLVPMVLAVLILVSVLPRPAWRRRAAAVLARAYVAAARLPMQVEGRGHFPPTGPLVVAANHASYIDGLVLLAVVPERCEFVAKQELARSFPIGPLLRGIGTRFVERFDVEGSVGAAQELAAQAAQGASFVVFPEGTLQREPGLRPFRMGAFVAAAAARTPVVPVAIRGTRSVLRDGQWRPRPGLVRVIVTPPLAPDGSDWAAAVRLRERARSAILAACGEPDVLA
jgi:1-acyl-sn-glycerol-3-phosphate acyltransferase